MANKIYKLGKTATEINNVLTDLVDLTQDENDNKFLKVVAEDGEVHIETEYLDGELRKDIDAIKAYLTAQGVDLTQYYTN